MTSTSTIFIKKPLSTFNVDQIKEKYKEYSPLISFFLWSISTLYSSSKINFTNNITGVTLSFPMPDLVFITISTLLLHRGLTEKSIMLMVPWLLLSSASIYFNHYKSLMNILTSLKHVKKLSWLPWSALIISIVLLIIRICLIVRVMQLCANLWFKNKMDELKITK